MAFEIEMKAWADDFESVKMRLNKLGNCCHSYEKYDSYWFSAQSDSEVRLRRERNEKIDKSCCESVLVTFKKKLISGGIEINNEMQFSVSDAGIFEEMLNHLGLQKIINKEKRGWAWTILPETEGIPPILAELSMVTGLGWFIELEIIEESNNQQTVNLCRKRLFGILEQLGIPEDKIETRPYNLMLSELKNQPETVRA